MIFILAILQLVFVFMLGYFFAFIRITKIMRMVLDRTESLDLNDQANHKIFEGRIQVTKEILNGMKKL